MSSASAVFENSIDYINYTTGSSVSDYNFLSYSKDLVLSSLPSGSSYIPTVNSNYSNLQATSSLSNENAVRNFLSDYTLSTIGAYLKGNDYVVKEVLSPYSGSIGAGTLTFGQAVSQGFSGNGYLAIYDTTEVGAATKTITGLGLITAFVGMAVAVYNSGTPLNEFAKQSWGIAGGLSGAALFEASCSSLS